VNHLLEYLERTQTRLHRDDGTFSDVTRLRFPADKSHGRE